MKIIFAQGNPGDEYKNSRHNVGFQILDSYAIKHGVKFSNKPKFFASIAEYSEGDEKVLLVKPTTFYNETGASARALVDFYKVNPSNDVFVVHDDLALPFGTLRTREKGSDAGNNGIKSLNTHIGPEYARLRVGIYNEIRDKLPDTDFVLSRFTKEEHAALNEHIIPHAAQIIDDFITGTHQITSHRLDNIDG